MKRKILLILMVIMLVFSCAFITTACRFTKNVAKLEYTLNEDSESYMVKGERFNNYVFKKQEVLNTIYITIPETYNDLPVTVIGDYAFEGYINLKGITLPDTITSIKSGAFNYCEKLKNIYYTGSLEQWGSIDNQAADKIEKYAMTIHYNYKE